MKPTTKDAYKLFHEGVQALAVMEQNGIRVDVGYVNNTISSLTKSITEQTRELRDDKVFKLWRRIYGDRTNIDSGVQLEDVLFKHMGYKAKAVTATGRAKTGKAFLDHIDLPFLKTYHEIKKHKRVRTRLKGILEEVCDGFFHVSYNLHTAVTYRSSASLFQNMDARDEESAEYIRKSFIPRNKCVIPEIDYGALEWKIATCKWADPEMIRYNIARDKNGKLLDIHRDMASKCYKLEPHRVTKSIRYCGKGCFVFPKIYGSYYKKIARNLWLEIDNRNLTTTDGVPLKKHLESKGIVKLGLCEHGANAIPGTFEHHIMMVERAFEKQFHVMIEKAKKWWADYLARGWFRMMTGFIVRGELTRNDTMNYDIQGPGFHCLLWSIIEHQKHLVRTRQKSKLIATIHDCYMGDVPENELQDFLETARDIMTVKVRKHWDWIIVPLEVEADVVAQGTSWVDKKPWERKENGLWTAKV